MTKRLICTATVINKQFYFADLCAQYLHTVLERVGVVEYGTKISTSRNGEDEFVIELEVKQGYNKKKIRNILEGKTLSDNKKRLGTEGVLSVKEVRYVSDNDADVN